MTGGCGSVLKPEGDDASGDGWLTTPRRLWVTALIVMAYGVAATGAITSADDIDDEVRRWMRKAYDAAEPGDG